MNTPDVAIPNIVSPLANVGTQQTAAQPPAPQPSVPGPVPGTRMLEQYVRDVGRFAYFWAWPLVNMHNRRIILEKLPEPGLMGGIVPVAPPNRLMMLRDYIVPQERLVACPNQDVVYGFGLISLDRTPVVVQVPDFKDRFWVYQIVDQRTDGFAELGSMYATPPGFYLLVGPDWKGVVPAGISKVFRASTNLGVLIPRVFVTDDAADKEAAQGLISGINVYPLAEFDGRDENERLGQRTDISEREPGRGRDQVGHSRIVLRRIGAGPRMRRRPCPAKLRSTPMSARFSRPLPRTTSSRPHSNRRRSMPIGSSSPRSSSSTIRGCPCRTTGRRSPMAPRSASTTSRGRQLPSPTFFVNKSKETRYFYLDADTHGGPLSGSNKYTMSFAKGQTPPVKGFWSLTLYNEHHFFAPNDLKRYSLGTKNKNLKFGADGSLTLYVQADAPSEDLRDNWLPAPKNAPFVLYARAYWPEPAIANGSWTPPAVVKAP